MEAFFNCFLYIMSFSLTHCFNDVVIHFLSFDRFRDKRTRGNVYLRVYLCDYDNLRYKYQRRRYSGASSIRYVLKACLKLFTLCSEYKRINGCSLLHAIWWLFHIRKLGRWSDILVNRLPAVMLDAHECLRIDDKSIFVLVMAWSHMATSNCLSQCWQRSLVCH